MWTYEAQKWTLDHLEYFDEACIFFCMNVATVVTHVLTCPVSQIMYSCSANREDISQYILNGRLADWK